MKKGIYIAVILVLVVAFGFSAYQVGSYLLESKEQSERFAELSALADEARSTVPTQATGDTETDPTAETVETEATEPGMLPGYAEIYELNNDVVGWIRIADTELDYPVMQTSVDNRDYYLNHDFDGNGSGRGCIYAREECDVSEPSDNITLYGHNMKDGSMFAALNAYVDKKAWENNSLIFFDTLTEYHTYKIFAVFKTTANLGEGFTYHQFVDAENEADFNEFVATCKELAFYETGETPKYGDKLICLSTCEYTLENGRLVVAAYRIS